MPELDPFSPGTGRSGRRLFSGLAWALSRITFFTINLGPFKKVKQTDEFPVFDRCPRAPGKFGTLLEEILATPPVASPRGGGKLAPPTSDRTPREIDADPRRSSCPKKMGVGLQDLLRSFTCTDATADVLWSHDKVRKRGSCGIC